MSTRNHILKLGQIKGGKSMKLKKFMSFFVVAVMVLGMVLGFTACGKKQTQSENTVVVYSPNETDINDKLVNMFQTETGIKVQVITAGTADLLNRIKAESGNSLGDVMFGGGAESLQAFSQYFEAYTTSEDASLPDGMKAKDHVWNGFSALPMVIMYNKSMVKDADAPKSWADLTDPKWKGKISFTDPNKSGSAYTQMITMYEAEGGWDFVQKFINNLDNKVESSSSNVPKKVSDGEFPIGVTLEESAQKYVVNGANVGYVYPSDGTSAVPDGIALIKGAKDPIAAKKFIDFMVGKEAQSVLPETFQRRSVRSDVASPKGLTEIKDIKLVAYDFDFAANQKTQNLQKWNDMYIK